MDVHIGMVHKGRKCESIKLFVTTPTNFYIVNGNVDLNVNERLTPTTANEYEIIFAMQHIWFPNLYQQFLLNRTLHPYLYNGVI